MPVTITCNQIDSPDWRDNAVYKLSGATDVWLISISSHIQWLDHYHGLLSADEEQRSGRYHQQKDRERFIVSRGVLRTLLGGYLNTPAADIVFKIAPDKKPFVNPHGVNLEYNTAHSGGYILIAIAGSPVGVDIEQMQPDFPYMDILEHSFSPLEVAHIHRADVPLYKFYNLWTRKEALLKATGKGIDDDMAHIPCIDGEHIIPAEIIGSNRHWLINTFNVDENYVCSVAIESQKINVNFFNYSQ
jgi:4'-phosphopantetheinyl transferase